MSVEPSDPALQRGPVERPLLERIPGIRIDRFLGSGGMGAVYAGYLPGRSRPVAVKMTPRVPGCSMSSLVHEAQVMAMLSHPNIVEMYDFGGHEDLIWIVMEYVGGCSLRHLIRSYRLSQALSLALFRQLCEALEHIHARGIIHQDLKPENILVDHDNRSRLIDFGLAEMRGSSYTITRPGRIVGTVRYMAPERRTHHKVTDHRVDLYALGVLLHEMLTGKPPTRANLARLAIHPNLDPIIRRCLRRNPEERWQTASDLLSELDRIGIEHQPPASQLWATHDTDTQDIIGSHDEEESSTSIAT